MKNVPWKIFINLDEPNSEAVVVNLSKTLNYCELEVLYVFALYKCTFTNLLTLYLLTYYNNMKPCDIKSDLCSSDRSIIN